MILEILVKGFVFITVNKNCYFLNPWPICYNTIIPPLPRLADWSHSFRFHHEIPVFISLPYVPCALRTQPVLILRIILIVSSYLHIQITIPARKTA